MVYTLVGICTKHPRACCVPAFESEFASAAARAHPAWMSSFLGSWRRPRLDSVGSASRTSIFNDLDEDDDDVRVGRIDGLSARKDLNGKLGRAVRWVAKKDRWAIVMVDSGEKILVRDEYIDFAVSEPALGLPVVSGLQSPEPVSAPAAEEETETGSPETGSPGHPVKGMALEKGSDAPSPGSAAVPWIMELAQCFCMPIGGLPEDKAALHMSQPSAAA